MDDNVKRRYAQMIGASSIDVVPDHIVKFFDDAVKIYYPMTTFNSIPREHWPLFVILADKFAELDKAIAELKDRKPEPVAETDSPELPPVRKRGRPRKNPLPEPVEV